MPMMPCTRPALEQFIDDRRRPLDLVAGGGVAVGAIFLAHYLDRHAAAPSYVFGADVAGERRRLLHAEIEQDSLMPAARDQILDEDDFLAAGVQIADDDDALLAHLALMLKGSPPAPGAGGDQRKQTTWSS